MLNATICTIGDEILIGQIIDTNSSYISKELNSLGIKVGQMISISDDHHEIIRNIEKCTHNSDIIIVTGGLGPTKDDITKAALAEMSNCPTYHYDNGQLEIIKGICSRRGIILSDINRKQALVPDSCTVLTNNHGTAPGMVFTLFNKPVGSKSLVFSLPGVPYEMSGLMPKVIETIKSAFEIESIYHKTVLTFGIPESILAKTIESWEDKLPREVKLAYLPNPISGVKLRLSIYGGEKEKSVQIVSKHLQELKNILGDSLYGEDDDSLQSVISDFLRRNSLTLSVAESCTGGKISSLLTSIPGSSKIFKGSVVAYHNDIKINLLNVKKHTIETFGAVSEECVEEMAKGVRQLMSTNYSIATSGIAGPDGGTLEKPVGTLCISVAGPDSCHTAKVVFSGDRERNIDRFSSESLNRLRLMLGIRLM